MKGKMVNVPKFTTFSDSIEVIASSTTLNSSEKITFLCEIVYKIVDEFILLQDSLVDKKVLSKKSIGKKISYINPESSGNIIEALSKFRTLRLRFAHCNVVTNDQIDHLLAQALEVIEVSGLGNLSFFTSMPLGVTTVNSVSIETSDGYRYFNILHADVLSVPGDLTVISTHANTEASPSGQIVNALKKKGIKIDPENIFQVIEKNSMWTCFQEFSGDVPIKAILTARMKASKHLAEPEVFFDKAVKGIFASIAALEYLGHRFQVINIPLIYGSRIRDYQAAIESLLSNALVWLKKSDFTEAINFVIYSSEELTEWDFALNRILGRSVVAAGSDQVLKGIVKELSHQLANTSDEVLAGAIVPLQQSLEKTENICIQSVCIFGRKLCELLASAFIVKSNLKLSGDLCSNIERLGKNKIVAPWICSYMHSLRIFGNETVHGKSVVKYLPKKLNKNDLVATLSAINSLLAFWNTDVRSATSTVVDKESNSYIE